MLRNDRRAYLEARTTSMQASHLFAQFVEQRLRLFEIGRIEPFGEPAADQREKVAGFGVAAWSRRSRARLTAARNSQSLASCSSAMLRASRCSSSAASVFLAAT
jgi:hypothetical protein